VRAERLIIRNFRNLADVEVLLSPGTVIVGENRSGKSNLLHALRLVLDPAMPNSERHLRREDFWDGLSDGTSGWDPMAHGVSIEVSVDIGDFDDEPGVIAALSDALLQGEPMRARLTYLWAPQDTGDIADSAVPYRWRIVGGDKERDTRVPADVREHVLLTFLHALRDVEADIRSWRRSPLRALLEAAAAIAEDETLDEVRLAMQEANEQLNQLDAIADLSRRISGQTLAMVGDNQALEAELGVAPPDPLRLIRGMRLFVDGDAHRDLASASLGTLNVLYLALLELGLEQRLERSEIGHVILGVEEPEAHLHPHCRVAGGISAPGPHRSGREPLDSSGSCHPVIRACTAGPSARTGQAPVPGPLAAILAHVCRYVSAACTSTSPSASDGDRRACRVGSPCSGRTQ
jgi:putative ATP-dependent endonuclease of the OLD family